jgi:hypothetical protein
VRGRTAFAIVRLRVDGRVDPTFGDRGTATVVAGTGDAVVRAVAVSGDSVVVTGDARAGGPPAMATVVLDAAGHPVHAPDLLPFVIAGGVAPDGRGGAVAAGTSVYDGRALIVRLGRDGARDASYGGAGVARVPPGLTSATWQAVAAAPGGGTVVVGSGRDSAKRSRIAAVALLADGRVAGRAAVTAGDGDAFGTAVSVNRYGTLLAAGTAVRAYRPIAVTVALDPDGRPAAAAVRRTSGQLAGIAGNVVLTNEWDGRKIATSLTR